MAHQRTRHELDVHVTPALADGSDTTYSAHWEPVNADALDRGTERGEPEPMCMFCDAHAPDWVMTFQDAPPDAGFGHSRSTGVCKPCLEAFEAEDWQTLTDRRAESTGPELGAQTVQRARLVYEGNRRRTR